MENLFIVLSVAAIVEFGRRIHMHDYFAAITIAASALVGALAGVFHAPGVSSVWVGIIAGLTASGLVTVASRPGKG